MTSIQITDTETHFDYGANALLEANTVISINNLRCLNDALIVHQLPIELLLSIFESVLRTGTTASIYYRRICALSGVCARWFFIIQHSPLLWRTVAGVIKEDGLRKVLERSSGNPIDVEYKPQGERWRYPEGPFTKFFDIIGPTTERWRTLVLATRYYTGDRPRDFLQFPAPNLERLVFENDQGWDMRDIELFGGNCPNLKHIHVENAQFKWSQAVFKGLESLKLSETSFDSVRPILDIIRDLPQLKKLEICNCDVGEEVPTNTQPVSLPNLQFLRAEFDNDYGLPCGTEQFLSHISAPPRCPLYVSLADIDNEEDSFVATFCEWLFGRQTKEVLEGVDMFKLGFDVLEDDIDGSVTFELFSGSAEIKGGIRGFGVEDVQHVLANIQGLFLRSHASKTFTRLRLSGCGVELLNNSHLISPFKDLPPITHLELVEPVWSSRNSSEDVHDGSALRNPSPFSTIKTFILRHVSPNGILDIVLGALGDPQARTHSMSGCRVGNLEHVEIHIEEKDFQEVEAVVEVLRNDSRIGKVDLYIAL